MKTFLRISSLVLCLNIWCIGKVEGAFTFTATATGPTNISTLNNGLTLNATSGSSSVVTSANFLGAVGDHLYASNGASILRYLGTVSAVSGTSVTLTAGATFNVSSQYYFYFNPNSTGTVNSVTATPSANNTTFSVSLLTGYTFQDATGNSTTIKIPLSMSLGTSGGSAKIGEVTLDNSSLCIEGVVLSVGSAGRGILNITNGEFVLKQGTTTASVTLTSPYTINVAGSPATGRIKFDGYAIPASTYNRIVVENSVTSAAITVSESLTINNGGTLAMGANQLTLPQGSTLTNNGTISTTVTSGWVTDQRTSGAGAYNGTINFVGTGQTIPANTTYTNLTLGNSTLTNTAGGAITVNGTLTTTAGGTFAMGANTLTLDASSVLTNAGTISTSATLTIPSGATLTNSGTILTTAATPFTDNRASKTYGGTVNLSSASGGQTILTGFTFNNLTLSNTSSTNTLDVSAAVTVNGTLTVTNANMYLILNGGTLTVNTFAGNGALTGSSASVVIYNGTTSSTMRMDQTNDLSSNRLKYLKLNSGALLTLGNKLVIYGGSGNSGGDIELVRTPSVSTLTTGGFLTLKHSGSATGHAIIGGLASLSGSVSVEDYFESGSRTYRQAGSVLSGGLPVNQITDDFDLYATNPGVTDANGFLPSTAGVTNPSLLIYNEASSPKWVPIVMSNPVSTLAAGKGFAFFMRPAGSGASGNYNDQYFDYSGNINNSDLTLGSILTYSGTSGISSTNGFNLLANPYCSYLDLNQFFLDNTHLDPVIYKLNKLNRGHESYGLKTNVSLGLGAKWNKTSNNAVDLDAYIDPGDAFFVKLKTTSGGAAPSSTSVVFKLAQVATSISSKIGGIGQNKMEIDSNSYSALTVTMKFMNDSINMDAVKLVNSSVGGNEVVNTSLWDIYDMRSTCNELSLVSVNNDMLAVKTLNSNKNWIVPMNVATCSKGKCYFDFNIDYNKPGMEATFELYDKYLKKNFTIVSGSKYEFEVSDIPQSFGADRFYINMNNSALGARYDNNLNSFELYPNPVAVSGKIYIKLNSNEPGEIEIRNVVGQTLSKKEFVANSGQLQLDLERYNFLPGTYFISCKQKSGTATKRVTLF